MAPCSYLEEGEVAVSIDAGNLQIAHDDFTVLVELLQAAVLLVQVGQSAQLVLCAGTNWRQTQRKEGVTLEATQQVSTLKYDDASRKKRESSSSTGTAEEQQILLMRLELKFMESTLNKKYN